MVKKLLILGIVIVTLAAVYFTLYFIDVSGQILEVSWTKNVVSDIEEYGFTKENLKNSGISSEQARDIVNHPNQLILFFDSITSQHGRRLEISM